MTRIPNRNSGNSHMIQNVVQKVYKSISSTQHERAQQTATITNNAVMTSAPLPPDPAHLTFDVELAVLTGTTPPRRASTWRASTAATDESGRPRRSVDGRREGWLAAAPHRHSHEHGNDRGRASILQRARRALLFGWMGSPDERGRHMEENNNNEMAVAQLVLEPEDEIWAGPRPDSQAERWLPPGGYADQERMCS